MVDLVNVGGPQFNPNARGNQQGTLFSNRALNRANRTGDEVGHKGFSPNRIAEVRENLPVDTTTMNIGSGRVDHHLSPRGWQVWRGTLHVASQRPDYSAKDIARADEIGSVVTRDDVHQNVARSSVPVEHLRPIRVGVDSKLPSDGRFSPVSGDITIKPDSVDDSTLIHEIGHAVDFHTRDQLGLDAPKEPIKGLYSTGSDMTDEETPGGVQAARREGFADAYADVHYRDRRGRQLTDASASAYPSFSEMSWARYGGEHVFENTGERTEAYREARKFHGGVDLTPKPVEQQGRMLAVPQDHSAKDPASHRRQGLRHNYHGYW